MGFVSLVGADLPPILIAVGASPAAAVATEVASSPVAAVASATASAVASAAMASSPASVVASAVSFATSSSLGPPWTAKEALLSIELRGPFLRKTPAPHFFAVHEF